MCAASIWDLNTWWSLGRSSLFRFVILCTLVPLGPLVWPFFVRATWRRIMSLHLRIGCKILQNLMTGPQLLNDFIQWLVTTCLAFQATHSPVWCYSEKPLVTFQQLIQSHLCKAPGLFTCEMSEKILHPTFNNWECGQSCKVHSKTSTLPRGTQLQLCSSITGNVWMLVSNFQHSTRICWDCGVLFERANFHRPTAALLGFQISEDSRFAHFHKQIDNVVRRNDIWSKNDAPQTFLLISLPGHSLCRWEPLHSHRRIRGSFHPTPDIRKGHGMGLKEKTPQSCKLILRWRLFNDIFDKLLEWSVISILRSIWYCKSQLTKTSEVLLRKLVNNPLLHSDAQSSFREGGWRFQNGCSHDHWGRTKDKQIKVETWQCAACKTHQESNVCLSRKDCWRFNFMRFVVFAVAWSCTHNSMKFEWCWHHWLHKFAHAAWKRLQFQHLIVWESARQEMKNTACIQLDGWDCYCLITPRLSNDANLDSFIKGHVAYAGWKTWHTWRNIHSCHVCMPSLKTT